jgi:phosphatidylserine decarboxylase
MKSDPNNDLYYAVFYLAPGDYHRFHSPSKFEVDKIIHIPGFLRKVS